MHTRTVINNISTQRCLSTCQLPQVTNRHRMGRRQVQKHIRHSSLRQWGHHHFPLRHLDLDKGKMGTWTYGTRCRLATSSRTGIRTFRACQASHIHIHTRHKLTLILIHILLHVRLISPRRPWQEGRARGPYIDTDCERCFRYLPSFFLFLYYSSTVVISFSVCSCVVFLRSFLFKFFRPRRFGSQFVIPLCCRIAVPSRIKCRAANCRVVVGHLEGLQRRCRGAVLYDRIRAGEGWCVPLLPYNGGVGLIARNRDPKPNRYGRWTSSTATDYAILVRTILKNYRRM